jgi:hypothetical protein
MEWAGTGAFIGPREAARVRFSTVFDEAARSADVGKDCQKPIAKGIGP